MMPCIKAQNNVTPIIVTQKEFEIIARATAADIDLLNTFLPADEQVAILGLNDTIGSRPSSTMTETETAIISVLAEIVRDLRKAPARK